MEPSPSYRPGLTPDALPCLGRFNPDVLFTTGSSCTGLLVFEFIILRCGALWPRRAITHYLCHQ
jgi:hypothetical protein